MIARVLAVLFIIALCSCAAANAENKFAVARALVLAAATAQCAEKAAAPAPAADAGAPSESAVCANLARVGCPEGEDPLCPQVFAHALHAPVDCLLAASSAEAARACGFVRCQP